MARNYTKFIEENFLIKNKLGQVVPFNLWNIQDKYLLSLKTYYTKELQGVRDIILKARKEGFSSFILAMFMTDFILSPDPINSVCIADRKDETKKLFERGKFFLGSFLSKHKMTIDDLCVTVNVNEIVNKQNNASFWIGTAGARTAPRVESVQNLHFSEGAHFPDTDIITARESIEGALQMVELGTGKVFIESTANGYGNYYQDLWSKASNNKSEFRPVFFGARELYSPSWLERKRGEFTTDEMFLQEYPDTPEEAFMSSGSKFFSGSGIKYLQSISHEPIEQGMLSTWGEML
jgi:hypothetical protein